MPEEVVRHEELSGMIDTKGAQLQTLLCRNQRLKDKLESLNKTSDQMKNLLAEKRDALARVEATERDMKVVHDAQLQRVAKKTDQRFSLQKAATTLSSFDDRSLHGQHQVLRCRGQQIAQATCVLGGEGESALDNRLASLRLQIEEKTKDSTAYDGNERRGMEMQVAADTEEIEALKEKLSEVQKEISSKQGQRAN